MLRSLSIIDKNHNQACNLPRYLVGANPHPVPSLPHTYTLNISMRFGQVITHDTKLTYRQLRWLDGSPFHIMGDSSVRLLHSSQYLADSSICWNGTRLGMKQVCFRTAGKGLRLMPNLALAMIKKHGWI